MKSYEIPFLQMMVRVRMGAPVLCSRSIGLPFLRPAVCQDILLSFSAAVRFFHETGFSGKGVTLRPVHEGGPGRRCGRGHLNLLGQRLQVAEGK